MITPDSKFNIDNDSDVEDRYDLSKFLRFTDTSDPLTSEFLFEVTKLKVYGNYVVVTEENRPDLVSYYIYGDVSLWWLILFFNEKTQWWDLNNGDKIRYPSLTDLEDLYFRLSALARAEEA